MSAEGKKKRGQSGLTNAQNSPFRINSWPPDWYARKIGAYQGAMAPSSGSTTMRGIVGGMLALRMGYEFHGTSAIYDRLIGHATARCTHPLLVG